MALTGIIMYVIMCAALSLINKLIKNNNKLAGAVQWTHVWTQGWATRTGTSGNQSERSEEPCRRPQAAQADSTFNAKRERAALNPGPYECCSTGTASSHATWLRLPLCTHTVICTLSTQRNGFRNSLFFNKISPRIVTTWLLSCDKTKAEWRNNMTEWLKNT